MYWKICTNSERSYCATLGVQYDSADEWVHMVVEKLEWTNPQNYSFEKNRFKVFFNVRNSLNIQLKQSMAHCFKVIESILITTHFSRKRIKSFLKVILCVIVHFSIRSFLYNRKMCNNELSNIWNSFFENNTFLVAKIVYKWRIFSKTSRFIYTEQIKEINYNQALLF